LQAMNLDPDDATLFSNRSLCRLRLGGGKKALTDAVTCKSMRPGWSKAYFHYYRTYYQCRLKKDWALIEVLVPGQ
ncbi:hypothetical protein BAE44_0016860, partial [Dichanthelium oligosanthes]